MRVIASGCFVSLAGLFQFRLRRGVCSPCRGERALGLLKTLFHPCLTVQWKMGWLRYVRY